MYKSWLDTINSKELFKPYNETKVEPRGFIGLFYLLKIYKMKSKNEWYLISVTIAKVKELTEFYLVCIYTNGLEEKQIEYGYGNEIPTIIES